MNTTPRQGKSIDLNCDMGESFGRYSLGNDRAMLDIVTSANIACGLHAGDPLVIQRTVEMAAARGVSLGAHPGYPDLQGFGRRAMHMQPAELEATLVYQLGALYGFITAAGAELKHVKPHGALYNTAAQDTEVAAVVARAIAKFDARLIVVTLPASALADAAMAAGLRVATEGFADRAYQDSGALVPRSQPGALIHDPDQAAARAIHMVTEGTVKTITGKTIPLAVDTLCVHGDTPNAPAIAAALRTALEHAGIGIRGLFS